MTLLVLEIRTPEPADIHSERELAAALIALAPRAAAWLLSLMTLGIFWVGQQTQLSSLTRMNRNLSWLHFVFLAVITALPFSTRLLAEFFDYRVAFCLLGQHPARRRQPLCRVELRRTGGADRRESAGAALRSHPAAGSCARRPLCDRRDRGPCQRPARRGVHHPDPGQLRVRAEVDELVVTRARGGHWIARLGSRLTPTPRLGRIAL